LTQVLGAELGGYVLTGRLPATGRATVLAALDAASRVERVGVAEIGGASTDGFRITVDEKRFAQLASPSTSSEEAGEASRTRPPVIDVRLDDRDAVVRLAVQPMRSAGDDGPAGWVVDYRAADEQLTAVDEPVVTRLRDVDLSRLRPAEPAPRCELPL
jgi:hypothetical protein